MFIAHHAIPFTYIPAVVSMSNEKWSLLVVQSKRYLPVWHTATFEAVIHINLTDIQKKLCGSSQFKTLQIKGKYEKCAI